jgi:hypothetical protein
MKKYFLKTASSISIITMIIGFSISMLIGFSTSLYGIHYHLDNIAYAGSAIVVLTCVIWWLWVSIIVKSMSKNTTHTANRVSEIQLMLKEVRQLVKDFKKL